MGLHKVTIVILKMEDLFESQGPSNPYQLAIVIVRETPWDIRSTLLRDFNGEKVPVRSFVRREKIIVGS